MKTLVLALFFILNVNAATLHLSISSSPSKLNPLISQDVPSSNIEEWIFSSLLTYDKDGGIRCLLAKSYKFIDDTTLLFNLREDVKWSDGVLFTANDVLFTYNLIHNPKVYSTLTGLFRYVKSVNVIDDYTLEIKYKEPYFKALEIWMMDIVPAHVLKDEKEIMTSSFNQHPIGTGKYTIKGFEISKDIVLTSNKNYFEREVNIEKLVFHFIPDPSTEFLMLKAGKIDMGTLTPIQMDRQIDEDFKKKFNFFERISNGYSYLGLNQKNEKFKNPKVREAISLSIDRQELIDILFFGHGQICNGPFMPGTFAYDESIKAPKQNIKKAKELLKEAGHSEKNPLVFEIITNSNNPTRVYAAQILQHQLRKSGIKVRIRTMEWQAFLNTVVIPREFEAVVLAWSIPLMPDAYSVWHSEGMKKGGFNLVNYKNKKVDALIKKAEKIIDRDKIGVIYKEISREIIKDNPYLFLYIPNTIDVVNKDIKNVSQSIIGVSHNLIDWIKP